jgi:hypothetical protein
MSVENRMERGGTPPLSPATPEGETSLIGYRLRSRLESYGFLVPAGALVILFFFIPVIIIFILSLSNLKASNFGTLQWWLPVNWSLDNYAKIFGNKFFTKILGNTLFYVVLTMTLFNFRHRTPRRLHFPSAVVAAPPYACRHLHPDVATDGLARPPWCH